jgi:hypothetical protein
MESSLFTCLIALICLFIVEVRIIIIFIGLANGDFLTSLIIVTTTSVLHHDNSAERPKVLMTG